VASGRGESNFLRLISEVALRRSKRSENLEPRLLVMGGTNGADSSQQKIRQNSRIFCGSPERSAPRTLSALLSQLTEYFKDHDLTKPEPETRKEKLPLDRAILVGARKITNQAHLFTNAN
jgi:hypothetical protein